jgi:hypothetical protein
MLSGQYIHIYIYIYISAVLSGEVIKNLNLLNDLLNMFINISSSWSNVEQLHQEASDALASTCF